MSASPLLGLLMGAPQAGALQVPNIQNPSAQQIGQQLQQQFAQGMQGVASQNQLQNILQGLQMLQQQSAASAPKPLVQPSPVQPNRPMPALQMMPTSYTIPRSAS